MKEFIKKTSNIILFCTVVYSLYCILLLHEYNTAKTFITEKDNFKKIKIKIDSVHIFNFRGSDKHSTDETHELFNNGNIIINLSKDYDKPIFTPNRKFEIDEVDQYMKMHHDSINIWYLNKDIIQYARENEKQIDLSHKIERLHTMNINLIIWAVLILITIFMLFKKFKSKSI